MNHCKIISQNENNCTLFKNTLRNVTKILIVEDLAFFLNNKEDGRTIFQKSIEVSKMDCKFCGSMSIIVLILSINRNDFRTTVY